MCGGGPKIPAAVDPAIERQKAAADAATATNAQLVANRRRSREQSGLSLRPTALSSVTGSAASVPASAISRGRTAG